VSRLLLLRGSKVLQPSRDLDEGLETLGYNVSPLNALNGELSLSRTCSLGRPIKLKAKEANAS